MKSAVVGAGRIARQHLACLQQMRQAEVVGVCDLSPARAQSTAERFGIDGWYTDYGHMLAQTRPQVVHVTTPVPTHFRLASEALEHGAHVFVEKPITASFEELESLCRTAQAKNRWLIEDHNYLFNTPVQRILGLVEDGRFGEVVHVEASICLDITGPDSPYSGSQGQHPSLAMPGGAISDFLTHLAYLACVFVGPHREVRTIWAKRDPDSTLPADEMRAVIDAERGTAVLTFSCHGQPDGFCVRVQGTKMRAEAQLFEPRLMVERVRGVGPLTPVVNGLSATWSHWWSTWRTLASRLGGGAGAYEGLWNLVQRTYGALEADALPPISMGQIGTVNRLVAALTRAENRV